MLLRATLSFRVLHMPDTPHASLMLRTDLHAFENGADLDMTWHDRTRAELAEALEKLRLQQSMAANVQGKTLELEEQAKVAQQRERSEKARHTEEMDALLAKVQELNTALQSSAGARDRAQEQCRQLQQELDKYVTASVSHNQNSRV
jgi:hypothetical protein